MHIDNAQYSAILLFKGIPTDTTNEEVVDWLWKSVGLCLRDDDVEIRPLDNGAVNALVRVPRRSLADFIHRAVSTIPFKGRLLCVRPKFAQQCPRPNEGGENER